MKKQVEGHASKQAPANRHMGYQYVWFKMAGSRTQSRDINDALKWYNNGAVVVVLAEHIGYDPARNKDDALTMGGSGYTHTIATWSRKWKQEPKDSDFRKIARAGYLGSVETAWYTF